ncbi:hypothetical protein [Streptomyces sp. NPDC004788]
MSPSKSVRLVVDSSAWSAPWAAVAAPVVSAGGQAAARASQQVEMVEVSFSKRR